MPLEAELRKKNHSKGNAVGISGGKTEFGENDIVVRVGKLVWVRMGKVGGLFWYDCFGLAGEFHSDCQRSLG